MKNEHNKFRIYELIKVFRKFSLNHETALLSTLYTWCSMYGPMGKGAL